MPPGRGRTRKNHESPRPSHSRAVAAFLALIALSSSVGCGRIGFGFERLPARSTDSGETDASVDARMGTSDGAPTDASDAGASGDASPVDGGDGFDGSTPSDATPDGSIPTCTSGEVGECSTACGDGTRVCEDGIWGACTAPSEICNGVDDDCDSNIDDGFTCASGSTGSCTTSCGSTGSRTCNASCGWGACTAPTEVCNGVDDDCDTNIDEGLLCTPTYRWTRTPTGTGGATSQVRALAIDAAGNVYVTGDFTSTINFGGSALVSAGMSDIFVASFDANGAHRWSFRYGSTGEDVGRDLVLDPTGNVVVTGYFAGTVNFGGGARASAGAQDIFVATFSSAGAHVRSARFGGSGEDRGLAVGVDTSGNVIVTGYFNGTVDFGGGARVSAGAEDVFIASYGPTGAHRWSLRFGGTSNDYGYGAVPDSSGNIFATGYFGSTVNFGGGALTSAGSYDIYVASYSSAGAHRWSQRFGGTGSDRGRGAAVDASGNVVVTGSMAGTVNFGGGALTSAGGDDIYVASFGSTGTHRWSRRFGSTSSDWGEGVAFDASGNTIMTGYFGGTINAGGSSLVSAGGEEIVLASFDASGAHRWSMRFGGTGNDQGIAVAASPVGNVTLTGFFAGTVNFGGGPVMALGSPTGFILRLQ